MGVHGLVNLGWVIGKENASGVWGDWSQKWDAMATAPTHHFSIIAYLVLGDQRPKLRHTLKSVLI
jgi:hypothetical protein